MNQSKATFSTVFLLDIDNTLLDNDQFAADLREYLLREFGQMECDRYWAVYEQLRDTVGYADYLGAVQHFRLENDTRPALPALSSWLLEYPFERLVYPGALQTIEQLNQLGRAVILSDGDIVFQPRKAQRAGIHQAIRGEVLIFVHKELALAAVQERYPASHYVMADDKPHLLAKMKNVMGDRLTTVFVRQGHYAAQANMAAIHPAPDYHIDAIGELPALASRLVRTTA